MGDEEKLPGNFPMTARAGRMQPDLTKPASPSTSMSLPAGLERDKSRQRDLPGDQLESSASPEDQFLRIFLFYDFQISHSMTLDPMALFNNMPPKKCVPMGPETSKEKSLKNAVCTWGN
ncbi:hypothetical protein DV515_00003025 [Chloebia gouldiae]|uniref:Uncharacterized protein n=1 Tax=Chloebia gouldiae TaxID=44316 RepID=A0A3L8SVC7_CHLGU|nr:hypothetical protein DV515_00003025 [Chloebia gouldiae]